MASVDSTKKSRIIKKQTTNHGSKKKDPFAIDANWIRSNIKMRRCTYFVPTEEGSTICHCGYEKDYHTNSDRNKSNSDKYITNSKWDISKHTKTESTNAFGEIAFVGREGDIKPKFVRVDINTEMSMMLEMIERGGMEIPKLLISVTGNTDDLRKKAKLPSGLMKAAHDIGAWIITGGTQADVTEPEMTLKENVVIGIAPWGVIHNRKALQGKEGLWPAKYDTPDKLKGNERFLDPNHSHYILVDDGTQHKLDIEIPFRVKLEEEIAKMKTKSGNDVHIVRLVLGGKQGTLETVDEALKKNTPAVVVKMNPFMIPQEDTGEGSGGAADILAYAIQHAATGDEDANSNDGQGSNRNEKLMTKSLKQKLNKQMEDGNINCSIEVIESCLLKSDLIHIFDQDSDDCDIDVVLLKALMRGAYMDRVKNQITKDSTNMWMLYALQYDKADFVKLLLDKGGNLETFLTTKRLLKLYNNDSLKRIFKDSPWKKKDDKKIGLNAVRHKVQDLVGHNYLQHYMDDKNKNKGQKKNETGKNIQITDIDGEQNIDQDANQRKVQDMKPNQESNQKGNDVQDTQKIGKDRMTMENPFLDLLIWSVLTNEQDKAKLFWLKGNNKMSAALVAHALFSGLSRVTDDRDLSEAIDNNSSEFMTLAIKVAKACSKVDEKKTYKLLTRKVPQWGNTTCIEIAVNAHNKEFISLKVCRDLFDKIWMGSLKPQNSIKRLLLCIAFPPLIIWLARFEIEFKENSNRDTNKSDGQEALCCLSSKRRQVSPGSKTEANVKSDKEANSSLNKPVNSSREACKCCKLKHFYNAPIIIFMHNMIFFVAFLFLYSYVLVSKLEPQISEAEICLILWVLSFLIGEIIQFSRIQTCSVWNKWKLYKADGWNVLDMLTILLFIIGMSVLMINPEPLSVEIARVILGIDLVFFFLRLLHALHAHRQVGPKLVMIMNMVWELWYMAAILGVFILAYAVASYAILYPNTTITIETLMKILKRPYWNIYGELVLEEIEGEANCSYNEALYGNGAVPRCPTKSGQYVVPVMMGIYMLMTNTLLLSLLIASFSYSIEKVQVNTDFHCSLHRYNLICEYCTKPWLAHPFAILFYLSQIFLLICNKINNKLQGKASCGKCPSKCCKCDKIKECTNCGSLLALTFKQTFDEDVDEELCDLEESRGQAVYRRMEQTREERIDVKKKTGDKRLEQLVLSKFSKLKKELTAKKPTQTKSNLMQQLLTSATSLDKKVEKLEQQILKDKDDMATQLQTIMDSLKELKEHKLETKQACNENTDEK